MTSADAEVLRNDKTDLQILDGLLKNYDRRATPPSPDKGEQKNISRLIIFLFVS